MNQILSAFFELTNINSTGWAKTIILVIAGAIFTLWVKRICKTFFKKIHFDNVTTQIGVNNYFKKINPKLTTEKFLCLIIQAFFIVLFLMFICEAVSLYALSNLLIKIILYYPNIFISIIIFSGNDNHIYFIFAIMRKR